MREKPKPFEVYEHFKGKRYQILCLAKSADDLSEQVVYQAVYGDYTIYVRSLAEFISDVDAEKYPAFAGQPRFRKLSAADLETNLTAARPVTESPKPVAAEEPVADAKPVTAVHPAKPVADVEHPAKSVASLPHPSGAELTVGVQRTVTPKTPAAVQETSGESVLIRFLDAETDEEKLNILTRERRAFTLDMTEAMGVTMDMEFRAEDLDGRLDEIRDYLLLKTKYETSRLH
ncbi:MAG: DUF1653 domain-containing protein [Lachnospiraceae bacterium]|nr:DUF1653 domain-containing protein [Lachnospiraceae bacterium]